MLQPIIRRPSRGTKRQFAGAASISPSSSRLSIIESMRSNCRLYSRFTRWTFRVGTTWFLHYCSDNRPFSPENQPKLLASNDLQSGLSQLMAEAPRFRSSDCILAFGGTLQNNNPKLISKMCRARYGPVFKGFSSVHSYPRLLYQVILRRVRTWGWMGSQATPKR